MSFDGFTSSEAFAGARSCPYCARFSTDGHGTDCPFELMKVETAELKLLLQNIVKRFAPHWRGWRGNETLIALIERKAK